MDVDKKAFVQVVVEKLFSRIFMKAQGRNIKEHKDILLLLIEMSWAEVKGVDFELSLKNLKNFDKLIFKDMCKQLGCADQVLLSLKREDDAIINSIVTVFNHSVAPKTTKLQCICNLLTSVCQRRHRVGVMEDPAEVEKVPSGEIIEPFAIGVPDFEFDGLKPDTADRTEGGEYRSSLESEPTIDVNKKTFVHVVLEKLFLRIFKKAQGRIIKEHKGIILRLIERSWAEVKLVDFELSLKNLKNFDKLIFKDTCKRLCCADQVLLSLKREDDAIIISIVTVFNHSVAPKTTKLQCIRNLFTSVCHRRHRVGVMEDPAEVEKVPSGEIIEPLAIEVPDFEFDGLTPDTASLESEPTIDVNKKTFVQVIVEKLFSSIVNKKLDRTIVKPRDVLVHQQIRV